MPRRFSLTRRFSSGSVGSISDPKEVEVTASGEDVDYDKNPKVAMQKKTFRRWVNNHLHERDQVCEHIITSWQTGVLLADLLEVLSEGKIKGINRKGKMKIHHQDNLNKCIKFMTQKGGIKLVNVGSNDIYSSNETIILGMIWTIILRYQLKAGGKSKLIGFVKDLAKDYDPDKVTQPKNFTTSFKDGTILCAMVHSYKPALIDMDKVHKDNGLENLEMALDAGEDLGIPKLVDAKDVHENPDEKSIMAYVGALQSVIERDDDNESTPVPKLSMQTFSTVDVDWDKFEESAKVDGILLEWIRSDKNKGDKFKGAKKKEFESNVTSFKVEKLEPDTQYDFRLFSLDGKKVKSVPSEMRSIKTLPDQMTELKLTELGDTDAKVSWDIFPRASGYVLQLDDEKIEVDKDEVSHRLENLKRGQQYSCAIFARIDALETKPSDFIAIKTGWAAPPAPEVKEVTANSAVLALDKQGNTDFKSFKVTLLNEKGDVLQEQNVEGDEVAFDDLLNNEKYQAKVAIELTDGDYTEESGLVDFKTELGDVAPPTLVDVTRESAILQVSPFNGAKKYLLKIQSGAEVVQEKKVKKPDQDVEVTKLDAGKVYTAVVMVTTKDGEEAGPSEELEFKTRAGAPPIPIILGTTLAGATIALSKGDNDEAENFIVKLTDDQGNLVEEKIVDDGEEVTFENLKNNQKYNVNLALGMPGDMENTPVSLNVPFKTDVGVPSPPILGDVTIDSAKFTVEPFNNAKKTSVRIYEGEEMVQEKKLKGEGEEVVATKLLPGKEYTATTFVKTTDGDEVESEERTEFKMKFGAPPQPKVLEKTDESVSLKLNPGDSEGTFKVVVLDDEDQPFKEFESVEDEVVIEELDNNSKYKVLVSVLTADGEETPQSTPKEIKTAVGVPAAPVVSDVTRETAIVGINPFIGAKQYHLRLMNRAGDMIDEKKLKEPAGDIEFTGLQPGKEYYTSLVVLTTDGEETEPSEEVQIKTKAGAPPVPAIVSTAPNAIVLGLNKGDNDEAEDFKVKLLDGDGNPVKEEQTNQPELELGDLDNNTKYQAILALGMPEGEEDTPETEPLEIVTEMGDVATPELVEVAKESATVSLKPFNNAKSYTINVNGQEPIVLNDFQEQVEIPSLQPGTEYEATLEVASALNDNVATSAPLAFKTKAGKPPLPGIVSNLPNAVVLGLSKGDNNEAGDYKVKLLDQDDNVVREEETPENEFELADLQNNTRYKALVALKMPDGQEDTPYSDALEFKTDVGTPEPVEVLEKDVDRVTVKFGPFNNAKSYVVNIKQGDEVVRSEKKKAEPDTDITVKKLSPGTVYTASVLVKTTDGDETESEPVEFKTGVAAPNPPVVGAIGENGMELQLDNDDDNDDIDHFVVQVLDKDDNVVQEEEIPKGTKKVAINGLEPNSKYKVAVLAMLPTMALTAPSALLPIKTNKSEGKIALVTDCASAAGIKTLESLVNAGESAFSWSKGYRRIYAVTAKILSKDFLELYEDHKDKIELLQFNAADPDLEEVISRSTIKEVELDLIINNGKLKPEILAHLI